MFRVRKAALPALPSVPALPARPIGVPSVAVARPLALTERVEALDMLRGLMTLAVAVYHMAGWTRAFAGESARGAVVLLDIYSVQGFFILSGFCFFALYREQRFGLAELKRFHVRRFLRIAPLYYLALALT